MDTWVVRLHVIQIFTTRVMHRCTLSTMMLLLHSDHTVAEENVRCTDSDNEEFCDSIEHLAMEEVQYLFCTIISNVKKSLYIRNV